MTIELNETFRPGFVRDGSAVLSLDAGEWLQIRSGNLSSPDIALQEQVPEGKVWSVRMSVYIEEVDA